jgi:hypothetical protein
MHGTASAALLAAVVLCGMNTADAVVFISMQQSGGDVVATMSGTLILKVEHSTTLTPSSGELS